MNTVRQTRLESIGFSFGFTLVLAMIVLGVVATGAPSGSQDVPVAFSGHMAGASKPPVQVAVEADQTWWERKVMVPLLRTEHLFQALGR